MVSFKYIESDPMRLDGQPILKSTRFEVFRLLELISYNDKMSLEEIARAYGLNVDTCKGALEEVSSIIGTSLEMFFIAQKYYNKPEEDLTG